MADRLERIRATLAELEAELRQLDSLDESTREALADATADIADTLRHGKRSAQTQIAESSLRDRLADFEASHPQLVGVLTRLFDGLAQLGI